jgi:hypothetical protein
MRRIGAADSKPEIGHGFAILSCITAVAIDVQEHAMTDTIGAQAAT